MEATRFEVPVRARGERLDQYLAAELPSLSRSRLQALVEVGAVRVDGRIRRSAYRLRGGEQIEVSVPELKPATAVAEDLPLSVLYEDDELVVVDKPAGMVVHPAAGHRSGTLVNALLFRVQGLKGVGGELRPGIVHRLDKESSGCLVVAKTETCLRDLQEAFRAREIEKIYVALVSGQPPDSGTFRTLHGRHPTQRKRFTTKVKSGRTAVTHFVVRERFEDAALVEVRLETGRTHQIRVHFADAGFPLLGDATYGARRARRSKVIQRQALHAWRLAFAHPKTGKRLSFEAPIPPDLTHAIEHLRSSADGG